MDYFCTALYIQEYDIDFDECAKGLEPTIVRDKMPNDGTYWHIRENCTLTVREELGLEGTLIRCDDDLKICSKVIDFVDVIIHPFTYFEIRDAASECKVRSIRIYPANNLYPIRLFANIDFRPESFNISIEGMNIGMLKFKMKK